MTASLNRASDAPTTVTVTATAVPPATAADFVQSTNMRLEIAPGTTASTGRVLVTAVNDTAYTGDKSVTVAAIAHNRHGVTAPGNVTLTITDDEMAAPGTPGNAGVTAGVGSLAVRWDAATDADGYKVQWKSGSESYAAARRAVLASGTVRTYTITGLTPGTATTVSVIATRTGAADGPVSAEAAGTPKAAPPGTPAISSVTAGVGSLAVAWTAATDADGYKVQWKTGAEAWDAGRQIAVTGTGATITGLTAGTAYTVRVIATRAHADDGPASSAVGDRRPTPAPPGRVPTVTVTREVGQLAVSWTAATDADGYKVQWKEAGGAYDAATRQHTPTGTSQTITGLAAGTAYTVRVIATRTNAADGAPSYEVHGTPKAARPAAPADVQVGLTAGAVTVEWSVVEHADAYKVQWKTGNQSYDTSARQAVVAAPADKDATKVAYTVTTTPTADTTYTVRVIATRTHADDGPASQEASVEVKEGGGPGTPASPLTVTPGVGTLVLSWQDVKDATDYRLQWKSGSESYNTGTRQTIVAQTQGLTETHTLTGLAAGTAYTVRVTPRISGADQTAFEGTGTPRAATPGQPTVTVTPGVGSLAVSWTAATGAGGYTVQWKSGSQNYNTSDRHAAVTGRSHTILGLTPGTPVTVRVTATHPHAAADGPASTATATPKHAPPGQVETVTVTPGVGSLVVSWTAATGAGGYKVQWKSGNQSYDAADRQAIPTGTSYIIAPTPSLAAGTAYTVRVIATRTNADDGTPSVEATGTARAAAPGEPTNVTVTPGVGSLVVSWTAATGQPTGYTVQWKTGSEAWDAGRGISGTGATITGLTAGTAYTVRVIATRTHEDDGPASATATGTPTAAASTVPERVTVAAGVGRLTVTWSAATGASGYKVQWKSGSQNYDIADRQAIPTGTSHTIASLTGGTRYTVRVIATRTNAADSAPSAEASGVPTAAAPGKPGNVRAAAAVEGLTVTWDAAADAGGYKVQWKAPGESYDAVARQVTATGTSRELTGLTAGTTYTVRVIATRAHADDGPVSDEATGTPRAAPAAQAMNVRVVAGIGSLTVSWPAAADAGSYKVQWKQAGQSYDAAGRQHVTTGTSYTIPNLAPGTAYTVRVIATRMSATDSPPSAERTGTPRAAAPGKPAGVTPTSGVRRIAVAWTAVADADRYTVQWKVDGGTYAAANEETVTGTSYTVTGLTAGTAYTVRVTAGRDHADAGPASDEAAATAWDVTLSATALTLDEDPGNTNADRDTYTLRLSHAPTGSVTVTAASSDPAVTLAPTSLTFTTTTWNTAQAVTATAADDDDTSGETVTLSHAAPGFGTVTGTVTVTVTDDDMAGLTVSDVTGDAREAQGDAATVAVFDVQLATEPTAPVTVAVTSQDTGEGTVAPSSLTFGTASWNTAQTVTVTGVDDDFDDGNKSYDIYLDPAGEAADAYAALTTHMSTRVTTVDDDTGGVTFAPTELTVTEGGAGKTITLVLTASPESGTVWVGLVPHCKLTVGGLECTRSGNLNLSFTAASWNTAQTVVITGVHDTDGENETIPLQYALSGFGASVDVPDTPEGRQTAVTVTVEDDDVPALVVNPTALPVAEGASATYTVRLRVAPDNAAVTVAVEKAAGGSADVSFAPTANLIFSETTWNTAQTVTVSAAADDDGRNDAARLTHRVTSSDAGYDGLQTSQPARVPAVAVTVTDADAGDVGVTVDTDLVTTGAQATTLSVTEDGRTTAAYTVVLGTEPDGPVTVTVGDDTGTPGNDLAKATPAPGALTFDASSWDTAQTVTVTGAMDDDDMDETVSLAHTLTTDSAGDYAAVTVANYLGVPAVADVTVKVTDNDAPNLSVSAAGLTGDGVQEGTAEPYTVALTTQPSGQVTVAVRSSDGNRATLATGTQAAAGSVTLTFAANAWDTAQTVTVAARRDADAVDATVTLTHDPGGAEYAALADVSLTFTVTDTTPPADPTLGPDVMAAFAAPAFPNQTYTVRQEVRVQLPATSAGNPPLTYTLTPTLPARLSYDGTTRRIVGAAAAVPDPAVGTYTHTVTDADGDSATQTVRIEIVANPQPTFAPWTAPQYTRGDPYTLPAPSIPDGGRLAFALTPALPEGLRYMSPVPSGGPGAYTYADGGTISGDPAGGLPTNRYTLTVTDADGDVATVGVRLAQPAATSPPPPVYGQPTFGDAAVEPQQYRQGETIPPLVLPAATGGDAPLSYALTPALPAGLTYTAPADATTGGLLSGTPTALQAETTYTLTATDANGDTATLAFTLTVEADLLPSFGTVMVAAHGYPVGTAIVPLVLPAATGGNAPLSYTLTPAVPPGLTYTAPPDPTVSGGTLAGTPTEVRAATTYTLTATDADGDTATLVFPLTITPAGRLVPGEGTTAYPIGGQRLTITRHPDTPAVEIDLPATLARDVAVTLRRRPRTCRWRAAHSASGRRLRPAQWWTSRWSRCRPAG